MAGVKAKRFAAKPASQLAEELGKRLVGQADAIAAIVPYIRMYQAGLCSNGRPIAVFLLLGPTGTGKTRTVEALAEVLHGAANKLARIDCGEFQLEHEVAKLIGAPPGYLGHRETVPLLTNGKLIGINSDKSDISLVLFDEIEKASLALSRLLLGVLDKATLRLGDNTSVSFEKTIIFMTSNLGAKQMGQAMGKRYGLAGLADLPKVLPSAMLSIATSAVKRKYSPEFINRIDRMIAYQPLAPETLAVILEQQLAHLQSDINLRRGVNTFYLDVSSRSKRWLLKIGASDEYGARELKRTIHRELMQPLATVLIDNTVPRGSTIRVDLNHAGDALVFKAAS